MSVAGVNRFCHRLTVDPEHRAKARERLPAALTDFDLSPRERQAISTGDVGFLLSQGVHPLLLVRLHVHSIAGLTEERYSRNMRCFTAAAGNA